MGNVIIQAQNNAGVWIDMCLFEGSVDAVHLIQRIQLEVRNSRIRIVEVLLELPKEAEKK